MAKEPAGLRRWRLAHRKHKKHVVHTMARRRRHYRVGRKSKGRRGSRAIPVVQLGTIAFPIVNGFRVGGLNEVGAALAIKGVSGIDIHAPSSSDWKKGAMMALVLIGETKIGGKVANMTGVNKLMKKATGGYFKLM
jgi:hypothetical protein